MKILVAALISEGLLVILSLLIQLVFTVKVTWNLSGSALLAGVLLSIPPLAVNHVLWRWADRTPASIYHRFSREVVVPLCRQATPGIALAIAILSGLCEEWFFRGALNSLVVGLMGPLAGCLLTSILFAAVHFIGSFKRYGRMIPLYTVMGIYLWLAHRITNSLSAVAVLHGVYNLLVILVVRRLSSTTLSPKAQGLH
jgi:membrane protease YdiL (CAAX protease family)